MKPLNDVEKIIINRINYQFDHFLEFTPMVKINRLYWRELRYHGMTPLEFIQRLDRESKIRIIITRKMTTLIIPIAVAKAIEPIELAQIEFDYGTDRGSASIPQIIREVHTRLANKGKEK